MLIRTAGKSFEDTRLDVTHTLHKDFTSSYLSICIFIIKINQLIKLIWLSNTLEKSWNFSTLISIGNNLNTWEVRWANLSLYTCWQKIT